MQALRPWLSRRTATLRPRLTAATVQQRGAGWRGVWTRPGRLRRRTPPRRKDVPLFEVSERVLELDAEKNPSVRPYDEETDGAEAAETWRHAYASIDALSERLGDFAHEAEQAEARMRAVAAAPTPWRVSDHDIWSVALMDSGEVRAAVASMEAEAKANRATGPTDAAAISVEMIGRGEAMPFTADTTSARQDTQKTETMATMGELLYRNGILARNVLEPSETIEFLLHRQRLAAKRVGRDKDRAWDKALASCRTLVETQRLLEQAGRTPMGRAAVMRNDHMLAEQLLAYLPSPPAAATTPEMILGTRTATAEVVSAMLLNASYCNTTATETASTETTAILGRRLCAVGLQAAAATGEPAAVQRFLDILARSTGDPDAAMAILAALSTIHAQLRGEGGKLHGSRADIFCLLTGACLRGEKTGGMASASLSFRVALVRPESQTPDGAGSLAGAAPDARNTYLGAVAELGGVRTLWEENHAPGAPPAGLVPSDILVRGVLRYAAYGGGRATKQHGAEAGHAESETKGTDSSGLDLAMLYAFEHGRAPVRAGGSRTAGPLLVPIATVRPEPWAAQPVAKPAVADSHLRDEVAQAFSESSVDACVVAIDALLRRHGLWPRA